MCAFRFPLRLPRAKPSGRQSAIRSIASRSTSPVASFTPFTEQLTASWWPASACRAAAPRVAFAHGEWGGAIGECTAHRASGIAKEDGADTTRTNSAHHRAAAPSSSCTLSAT